MTGYMLSNCQSELLIERVLINAWSRFKDNIHVMYLAREYDFNSIEVSK